MYNYEIRCFSVRADTIKEKPALVGMPIVYEKRSINFGTDDDPFYEIISRGAATEALKTSKVLALYDHSTGQLPLGSTSSGTLELTETDQGVRSIIYPSENQQWARDLVDSVSRGDLTDMSFAFRVDSNDQEWTPTVRRIHKFKEFRDVSIVPFGAYPDTSIAWRRRNEWLSKFDVQRDKNDEARLKYLSLKTKWLKIR